MKMISSRGHRVPATVPGCRWFRKAGRRIGERWAGIRSRAAMLAVIAGAAIAGSAACNPFGPGTDRFVVHVDSITMPGAVGVSEVLRARVFGVLGPDLCSRLDRVERGSAPGVLELRFHGEREGGRNCLQQPALLDHVEEVQPPLQDPFTLRVLQPDGSRLERVVRVR